jgi:hypothetical protein
MLQQQRRSASLEDARKAVMSGDAAVSNALSKVTDFIEAEMEVDPQIIGVMHKLERVSRSMMQATKVLTTKKLGRRS